MPRLSLPPEDQQTPEQKESLAGAVAGIRGRVPAPMHAWIRNPELATRAQLLGGLLRYQTTLEPKLSEMAILVCARHWTSHYEWTAHKREALKAGLDPEIIAAIAARRPSVLEDAKAQAIYDAVRVLMAEGRLAQPLYDSTVAVLGEQALVELVCLIGYYTMVALTLNTFELGLPEGLAPELLD